MKNHEASGQVYPLKQKAAWQVLAFENKLKAYDDVDMDDLFSEAQLEDFHRRVMKEVRGLDGKQTQRPMRTGLPPWRSWLSLLPVLSVIFYNHP